jgi:hypothetical protein
VRTFALSACAIGVDDAEGIDEASFVSERGEHLRRLGRVEIAHQHRGTIGQPVSHDLAGARERARSWSSNGGGLFTCGFWFQCPGDAVRDVEREPRGVPLNKAAVGALSTLEQTGGEMCPGSGTDSSGAKYGRLLRPS